MKHLKLELRHWTQADAMELTSLCNAVDRRFLSDRLPNPYTEKDAEEWLKTVSKQTKGTVLLVCGRMGVFYIFSKW